jgi:hypothetical protein
MKSSLVSNIEKSQKDPYPEFEQCIITSLKRLGDVKLFTTDAQNLFDLYLNNLPADQRQYYNCHACRDFLERYGGLVTITPEGEIVPAMWNIDVPVFFHEATKQIRNTVGKSKVTGVFISSEKNLGTPVTGCWTHLHVTNPNRLESKLHSSTEVMADKRSDYILLRKSIADYSASIVDQALTLLESNSLYRSEKTIGVAKWFRDVITSYQSASNRRIRDNLVWRAVTQAPPGYCHIGNTMIGTLLDDLRSGMSFEQVKERFDQKMDPTKYQRPQVAPTSGNIERAEKIVEKLGIERSLIRRFARLSEVQKIWTPAHSCQKGACSCGTGVFSHLTPKGSPATKMTIPEQPITWHKFAGTVLPSVISMEAYVKQRDNFSAILTAEHMDAPPIIQWDLEEMRNPFSWYVYRGGSPAYQWNLTEGYTKVTGICYQPSMWFQENPHQGKSILFILEGAKDSHYDSAGNGLFPEILKADLKEIRSTIEAYSRKAPILGYNDASACGIRFQDGTSVLVKVTTSHGNAIYRIDRWD